MNIFEAQRSVAVDPQRPLRAAARALARLVRENGAAALRLSGALDFVTPLLLDLYRVDAMQSIVTAAPPSLSSASATCDRAAALAVLVGKCTGDVADGSSRATQTASLLLHRRARTQLVATTVPHALTALAKASARMNMSVDASGAFFSLSMK